MIDIPISQNFWFGNNPNLADITEWIKLADIADDDWDYVSNSVFNGHFKFAHGQDAAAFKIKFGL